jgi:hypothetical protein
VNAALLVANAVAGWCYFFMVGARPDHVEPAWHQWFRVLWLLGPLWSIGSLVVAAITRKKCWETWVNAAISLGYVILWGIALLM